MLNLLHGISQELSVIAISETWLNKINEDCFSICGYNYVSNRRVDKTGGGVGIYLNNALVYSVREDLSRMFTFIECIFVEIIQPFSKNIIVGCVYRPPDTDLTMFYTEMAIILDVINVRNTKLAFVLGDFNVDLIV